MSKNEAQKLAAKKGTLRTLGELRFPGELVKNRRRGILLNEAQ